MHTNARTHARARAHTHTQHTRTHTTGTLRKQAAMRKRRSWMKGVKVSKICKKGERKRERREG